MRVRSASNSAIFRGDFSPKVPPAGSGFAFVPLGPHVAEADYVAIMSCRQRLRDELDWDGWPAEGFSLDENVDDLADHFAEYVRREAFAWSVFGGERCIGCVYLEPWEGGAQLAFWMIDVALALEERVVVHLIDWLADWPIERLVVPVCSQNTRALGWLCGDGWSACAGPEGHLSFGRAAR